MCPYMCTSDLKRAMIGMCNERLACTIDCHTNQRRVWSAKILNRLSD